ncbi:MAG: class I SAM-dependent methyltransferase, partial [Candidatus Aminicenantes bacterium]|nr:class I SAM-dependent methyltransferase [Candidatus Aminicenantes bacterium]
LTIQVIDPKKDQLIMDLACGDGRYTYLLNCRGYKTIGLDLSKELINEGKNKYGPLNLVVGDMRAIPGKYNIIFSLFTSFGYFNDDKENYKVFQSVSSSLVSNGLFWLDFLNPGFIMENLIPETITEISSKCQIVEKRKIVKNRIVKDIFFFEGNDKKHYQESVRLYSRTELESMFENVGIQTRGCFGDYRGNQWEYNSERTIIYGKKQN